jgi:hypothetical protein
VKKTLFIIFFYCTIVCGNDNISNPEMIEREDNNIKYPYIELSAGFGFLWFIQLNAALSIKKHLYFQPRLSSAIPVNEYGFVFGFQNRYQEDSIIRIGIGFSKGIFRTSNFHGGSAYGDDNWESLYIRVGLIKKAGERLIYNPNVSVTGFKPQPILSFNFTLGYCVFDKR